MDLIQHWSTELFFAITFLSVMFIFTYQKKKKNPQHLWKLCISHDVDRHHQNQMSGLMGNLTSYRYCLIGEQIHNLNLPTSNSAITLELSLSD